MNTPVAEMGVLEIAVRRIRRKMAGGHCTGVLGRVIAVIDATTGMTTGTIGGSAIRTTEPVKGVTEVVTGGPPLGVPELEYDCWDRSLCKHYTGMVTETIDAGHIAATQPVKGGPGAKMYNPPLGVPGLRAAVKAYRR
jgi:hypothetical protein